MAKQTKNKSSVRGRKPLWIAIIAIIAWLGISSVAGPTFGKLSTASDGGEIEIRASWTAIIKNGEELVAHLEAWCNLLAEISYLMPVPDGVASFRR